MTIDHNLGQVPGMIIVKSTSATYSWAVWHREFTGTTDYIRLNSTIPKTDSAGVFGDGSQALTPTSTQFFVGGNNQVSGEVGGTYVAYLFAHNDGDGEFGPDGDQDIIKCGSYTGNGSTDGPEIDLGFEPQWFMWKRTDATANWIMIDNMRGISYGDPGDPGLFPNESYSENPDNNFNLTATGLKCQTNNSEINASGGNYIYMAIRRGPLAPPEDATEVFDVQTKTISRSFVTTNFVTDFYMQRRPSDTIDWYSIDRMTGGANYLSPNTTAAQVSITDSYYQSDLGYNNGYENNLFGGGGSTSCFWSWKRAPGYFDVVAYTGNGTAGRTVSHNLGVAPEMMWVKKRSGVESWAVYHKLYGGTHFARLNQTTQFEANGNLWDNTDASDTVFTVDTDTEVNTSGQTYIAYLFASLPGISKVGSYTGTGNSGGDINVDCGFTSGARFVMIKRTDSSGNWWVADTTRGITSGNDPLLALDNTGAEITGFNMVEPYSSGFIVNGSGGGDNSWNDSGGSYIFYAIA
jgi:hypothetical protein